MPQVNREANLNWQIEGSGDYNGDGNADVLWRHAVTGQNHMHLMNGATIASSLSVNREADLNWQVVNID